MASAPAVGGALVARWWVPYNELSNQWGGFGKYLTTQDSRWRQGQRIVLYVLQFANIPSVGSQAFVSHGYLRVVCAWDDIGRQMFYSVLNSNARGVESYANPGLTAAGGNYYSLGTSQRSKEGFVFTDDGMYLDATAFAVTSPAIDHADALYIYAYAVPNNDAVAPLPKYNSQNSVGVQADAQVYGMIDYSEVRTDPFIKYNGYQGTVYPNLDGLSTSTHNADRDTLYRVLYYNGNLEYVRVPTLVTPETHPDVVFWSNWSAVNTAWLGDRARLDRCTAVHNRYCQVSNYSLATYESEIRDSTLWGCAPYAGLSWGSPNENSSDQTYLWSRGGLAQLGADKY